MSAVHKYIVLNAEGTRIGTITHPGVLDKINQVSGFEWRGKNYFYMPFHSNEFFTIFQEVGEFWKMKDNLIEEFKL